MIEKEEIIKILDDKLNQELLDHNEFKKRVSSAIEWWNENLIIGSPLYEDKDNFVSSKLTINGIKCLCTSTQIKGNPYFICEFTFRPLQIDQDLGSGIGNAHIVSF